MKKLKEHKELLSEKYNLFIDDDSSRWGINYPENLAKARARGHHLRAVCGANNPLREWALVSLDNFDKKYVKDVKLKSGEKLYRLVSKQKGTLPLVKLNANKGLLYFLTDRVMSGEIEGPEFEARGLKLYYCRLIKKHMNESFQGKKSSGLKDRINALIQKKKATIKELQPWTKKGEYKDLTKGAIRDLEAQTKKLENMLKNIKESMEMNESVHETMWRDIFKALDQEKDFKKFDVKKVADTNKLVKFLRFQLPMGPKTAMSVATTYGDYRAGRTKLDQAAKTVAKDLKKFQMKEAFGVKWTSRSGKPVGDKSTAPSNPSFTMAQMKKLQQQFGNIQKIDPSSPTYKKVEKLLDNMPDQQLLDLFNNKVKFLWSLAMNRLVKRGYKMKNKKLVKEEIQITEGEVAGWIAVYNRQKLEIKKGKDAKDLYSAKVFAIKHFKVPKSKQGLLAIKPAYNEETDLTEVLTKSDPKEKWIDDFIKSDAPQFKGKSKKERINMALAAFRAKQNEAFDGNKDKDDKKGLDDVDKKQLKGDFKDREDKDIDNDGDSDKSDKYLHSRRKAISKAIAKKAK